MLVSSPYYQDNFLDAYLFDNVEAVTLKLKPIYWDDDDFKALFEKDFTKYCNARAIEYCLVAEVGQGGNYHWHGIMGFPFAGTRKKFQVWFNKYFGHIHVSPKGSPIGWYTYVFKSCPPPIYYMFDGEVQFKRGKIGE